LKEKSEREDAGGVGEPLREVRLSAIAVAALTLKALNRKELKRGDVAERLKAAVC
jgi:hypothetical protein